MWIWTKDGQTQGQGLYSDSRRGLRPIVLNVNISCFFNKARIIQGFNVIAEGSSRPGEDAGHAGWSGTFKWFQREPVVILSS